MNHLTIEVGADGVAIVTLDSKAERMNLVFPEWVAAFDAALDRVIGDAAVTGVIVTSGKPSFMAGADLKLMSTFYGQGKTARDAFAFREGPNAIHRRMETSGKPFVAAINGLALGGGYELALACHHRIIVDDPKAVVGLPEVTVGLLPGSGGTQRLPRMLGVEKALAVLLSGETLKPAEALARGLVDAVVAPDQLLAAARAWLATKPDPTRAWDRKGFRMAGDQGLLDINIAMVYSTQATLASARTLHNYPAAQAILSAVFDGVQMPMDLALKLEGKYFAKLLAGPEARNIIRTSFVSKGEAERLARRPQGVDKAVVKTVGVLGAGMMGSGIAFVSALAGIDVALLDSTPEAAERGRANCAKLLAKDVERKRRTPQDADAILARIRPTTDFADLAGSDIVVEAVFEDAAIKADVTRKTEAAIGKKVIFASNTSTLPISELAKAFGRPTDFIGLHFFSPVDRMALVEVIMGRQTSQETLAHALDFVAQLRKTPIVVNDSRGFYTSRVFQTFIHEGMAMLAEGVAPALIENAARLAGMPVGPLAVTDEVTLELPMKIIREAEAQDGAAYQRPAGANVLKRMIDELGRPGRKAGGGFYEYPEGGKKQLWSGLATAFPVAAVQPDLSEVKTRLLYIQALDTVRCLDEGVLTHPADADLGSVLAWGYPTYTGGTISFIETIGLPEFVATSDRLAQLYGERFRAPDSLRAKAAKNERFYG